jgi:hypothetical protein
MKKKDSLNACARLFEDDKCCDDKFWEIDRQFKKERERERVYTQTEHTTVAVHDESEVGSKTWKSRHVSETREKRKENKDRLN